MMPLNAHLYDSPLAPSLEDQAHQRRARDTARQRPHCQLPAILLLARPRIHSHHQPHDIRARTDVEDLEERVPPAIPWRYPQQIQISRSEDQDIQELGEQGDALGGFVAVDGPDEDAFGGCVGEIPDDAKDVEGDAHRRCSFRGRL